MERSAQKLTMLARSDSNCPGGRREMTFLIVLFCSHAGEPNFPQVLEKNGGTTRLELGTSAVTA
jgi:hypothetical protein